MKKATKFLAVLLSVVLAVTAALIPAFAANQNTKGKQRLKVASISDTHVLAPELIKDTKDFQSDNAVGKMFDESFGILDAQLAKIKQEKANIVLIPGDLTKDGEQESHRALAKRLEKFEKDNPQIKVYVINGNHDINNKNAKNYNTADGKMTSATRTTPQDFYNTYKKLVYDDPTVIARFTPKDGKAAGQESYVARPAKGFTLIAIDSCRYSADNTDRGKDEHNTSGAVSPDLEQWVLQQIAAAKKRGDTVIGMEHHNLVPHFTMESIQAVDYVIHDWDRLAREYADAGMHYIFTGHYHANDVSKLTTKNGNDIYDIETGSAGGYPSPTRIQDFTRSWDKNGRRTETVDGKTIMHLKVNYKSSVTGKETTINDLTEYGAKLYGGPQGFTTDMINKNVYGYVLRSVSDTLGDLGIKFTEEQEQAVYKLVDDAVTIKIDDQGHNPLDLLNYAYAAHTGGNDKGPLPAWVKAAEPKLRDGTIVQELVEAILKGVPTMNRSLLSGVVDAFFPADLMSALGVNTENDIITPLLTGNTLSKKVNVTIGNIAADDLISFSLDTNYPDDNEFHIAMTEDKNGNMSDGKIPGEPGAPEFNRNRDFKKLMTTIGKYV